MDDKTKQRMLVAKDFINEKKYAEARAVLKTVEHPKAKEWLAKLDQIAPEKRKHSGVNVASSSEPTPSSLKSAISHEDSFPKYDLSRLPSRQPQPMLTLLDDPPPGANRSNAASTPYEELRAITKDWGCAAIVLILLVCAVANFIGMSNSRNSGASATFAPSGSVTERRLEGIFQVEVEVGEWDDEVGVSFEVSRLPSPGSVVQHELNAKILESVCSLRSAGHRNQEIYFEIYYGTYITPGGTRLPNKALYVVLTPSQISRLNCSNLRQYDLSSLAYRYLYQAPD